MHRLITQGTIEEKIAELLRPQAARSPTPCSARGETALTELSNDELRDLVTLRRMDGDGR